jgi:hypothetical protein
VYLRIVPILCAIVTRMALPFPTLSLRHLEKSGMIG